ncbi:lysoplasmalogenase family protein [Flavobacterium limnosediminis]|uniref:lysoplasmalogenase family protein n=1 Tax=Flavobacterium limnosediminis TaxID=1401027 RepID=UPI0005509F50|nr:lysoplasmalogenase family protein [Flavobacterium limnosediminis]
MNNKPALILYFIACAIFMLAVVMGSAELMLISKPIIAPSVFFYYMQEKKQRLNWIYVSIISLFFISDMIVLIDQENFFLIVLSLFLLGYLLFFKGILDDFIRIRFHFVKKTHLLVLLISVFLLVFLLLSMLDIVVEFNSDYLWLFVIYGLLLALIGFVSAWNYNMFPSRYTTFMLLTGLSFIISDVFYVLKKDSLEIEVFDYFNNFTQVLSYYFLTRYFLLKKNR